MGADERMRIRQLRVWIVLQVRMSHLGRHVRLVRRRRCSKFPHQMRMYHPLLLTQLLRWSRVAWRLFSVLHGNAGRMLLLLPLLLLDALLLLHPLLLLDALLLLNPLILLMPLLLLDALLLLLPLFLLLLLHLRMLVLVLELRMLRVLRNVGRQRMSLRLRVLWMLRLSLGGRMRLRMSWLLM